jgi:hypothetical protein
LKQDKYGFPPRLDHVWQLAEILAIQEREVLKARYIASLKKVVHNHLGKHWITRFLNRQPLLAVKFAQRINRQRIYANNPIIIVNHFKKFGKIIRSENIK